MCVGVKKGFCHSSYYRTSDNLIVETIVYKEVKGLFGIVKNKEIGNFDSVVNSENVSKLTSKEIMRSKMYNMDRCWGIEWVREKIMDGVNEILEKEFYTSDSSEFICIKCHPDLESLINA